MIMNLYNTLFFFIVYSVIGWVVEVVYHASVKGNITNRGFLNGPVCPVYGFGVILVLFVYNLIGSNNALVIFGEGILLTTAIELFAGWILDKCFHARWWDYSKMPFNLNGYICLAFSIIWGLAIVFVMKVAHPMIATFTVDLIPHNAGIVFLIVSYIIMFTDTSATISVLIGLNNKLKELDEISKKMREASDKLSTSIGTNSLKTTQAFEEQRIQYELAKLDIRDATEDRLKELETRYNELISRITKHHYFGTGHIIKAFPEAKHRLHNDILSEIKRKINK